MCLSCRVWLSVQVCTYRCIVTHESPAFEAFSLCILQKHNCLNNSAPIPMYPRPEPLRAFKGKPLTYEAAEDIYVGWLGQEPWSWKVVAGKNPAYDFFPNQHQIFYRGKRTAFWYDPVFRVTTYDGRVVWRRRHYRVKRAAEPGTFWFSVLDNGVTSNEYWTILDCADDFSWAIFHYSGAASVAGQQYRGALVVSRDGAWPKIDGMETRRRIEAALDKAGVKTWVGDTDTRTKTAALVDPLLCFLCICVCRSCMRWSMMVLRVHRWVCRTAGRRWKSSTKRSGRHSCRCKLQWRECSCACECVCVRGVRQ